MDLAELFELEEELEDYIEHLENCADDDNDVDSEWYRKKNELARVKKKIIKKLKKELQNRT